MADPINPKLTDDGPAEARRLDNEIRKITRYLLRALAEERKPATSTGGVAELDEDEPD